MYLRDSHSKLIVAITMFAPVICWGFSACLLHCCKFPLAKSLTSHHYKEGGKSRWKMMKTNNEKTMMTMLKQGWQQLPNKKKQRIHNLYEFGFSCLSAVCTLEDLVIVSCTLVLAVLCHGVPDVATSFLLLTFAAAAVTTCYTALHCQNIGGDLEWRVQNVLVGTGIH